MTFGPPRRSLVLAGLTPINFRRFATIPWRFLRLFFDLRTPSFRWDAHGNMAGSLLPHPARGTVRGISFTRYLTLFSIGATFAGWRGGGGGASAAQYRKAPPGRSTDSTVQADFCVHPDHGRTPDMPGHPAPLAGRPSKIAGVASSKPVRVWGAGSWPKTLDARRSPK